MGNSGRITFESFRFQRGKLIFMQITLSPATRLGCPIHFISVENEGNFVKKLYGLNAVTQNHGDNAMTMIADNWPTFKRFFFYEYGKKFVSCHFCSSRINGLLDDPLSFFGKTKKNDKIIRLIT